MDEKFIGRRCRLGNHRDAKFVTLLKPLGSEWYVEIEDSKGNYKNTVHKKDLNIKEYQDNPEYGRIS